MVSLAPSRMATSSPPAAGKKAFESDLANRSKPNSTVIVCRVVPDSTTWFVPVNGVLVVPSPP